MGRSWPSLQGLHAPVSAKPGCSPALRYLWPSLAADLTLRRISPLPSFRLDGRTARLRRSWILGRHQRYRDLATRRARNAAAATPASAASTGAMAESATRPRSLRRIWRASLRRGKGSSGASTPRKSHSGAQPSLTSKTSSLSGGTSLALSTGFECRGRPILRHWTALTGDACGRKGARVLAFLASDKSWWPEARSRARLQHG